MPPFCDLVGHVLRLCSEPEMVRVHAPRIVASVQHTQSDGNLTVSELPRENVRQNLSSANGKLAVAADVPSRCRPQPAAITLLHLRPKTVFNPHV